MMRTAAMVVSVVLCPALASATTCAVPEGAAPELGQKEGEERLAFIQREFKAEVPRVKLYMGLWGGGYSLLTLGQMAISPLLSPDDRADFYVGAVSSLVGLAAIVVLPPSVLVDEPALVAKAAGGDVCSVLADAEKALERNGDEQRFMTAWYFHVVNVAINLGFGAILGFGFKHWVTAALNAGVGAAIGEVMIFTTQVNLAKARDNYRKGQIIAPAAAPKISVLPFAVPGGGGLQLAGMF